MTDSFIAKVILYDSLTKRAKIKPMVILEDGTEKLELDAKTGFGIVPKSQDIVLVVTSRNNLSDESISTYYKPSWSNCRIVYVVSSFDSKFYLKGNYKFDGNLEIEGNLEITKDLSVSGNLEIEGESTFKDESVFKEKVTFEKSVTFENDITISNKSFLSHTHTGNLGLPTSPPI